MSTVVSMSDPRLSTATRHQNISGRFLQQQTQDLSPVLMLADITHGVRTISTSTSPSSSSSPPVSRHSPATPTPTENRIFENTLPLFTKRNNKKRTENNSSTGGGAASSSSEDDIFRPSKKSSSSAPASPKIQSSQSLEDITVQQRHQASAAVITSSGSNPLVPIRTSSASALPIMNLASDINATIIEVSANSTHCNLRRSVGAVANNNQRRSGLVNMSQNYLGGVLNQADTGINVLCNMTPEDIARQPDQHRKPLETALNTYRAALYTKITTIYGAKIYLYVQGQVANDQTLSLDTIQGLPNAKRLLQNICKEDTLNAPHTTPRVYSFHGQPGTGKATLIRSFCKHASWNLVIVNSARTEQNLLTSVAQFALLNQPCMVYFDHCEDWFCDVIVERQSAPAMGYQPPVIERQVLQRASIYCELAAFIRNSTQLNNGNARVWFAVATNRGYGCICADFRQYIGSNYAPEEEGGCQYTETQLFKIAENCWFTQLLSRRFKAPQSLQKSITMFREFFPKSFKKRFNYAGFTPEMLNGIIDQIFKLPVQRLNFDSVVNQTIGEGDARLMPNETDIEFVLHKMIHNTNAGVVHYNSNINC